MNSFLDPVELSLASKGKRFVNFLIDLFLLYLINLFFFTPIVFALILKLLSNDSGAFEQKNTSLAYSLYFILYIIFFIVLMTLQEFLFGGKTIGKFITGTMVVTLNGEAPKFMDYILRSLCRCIPLEAFSFFGETGWHDSLSKTRIVNTNEFMMNKSKNTNIDEIGKTE